jgi:NAD(P)-dependent dehydrogenase (short-subunit alcohol dehydrogenase family)
VSTHGLPRRLLRGGAAALVVNGRGDRPIIDEMAKEIRESGARAMTFLADVSKPDRVVAMVEAAVKEFGGKSSIGLS